MLGVVKAFFDLKLCRIWTSMIIYVLGSVVLLYKVGFWDFDLLKTQFSGYYFLQLCC